MVDNNEYNVCPSCGKRFNPVSLYCGHCGHNLKQKLFNQSNYNLCPICGRKFNSTSLYCGYCGHSLKQIFQKQKENKQFTFAVIDIETNYHDEPMSIGAVISNENFNIIESRYYILRKESLVGGMFSNVLYSTNHKIITNDRFNVMNDLISVLNSKGVNDLFAYNASFDKRHLPELSKFHWHDIMQIAAYKQTNPFIPSDAKCHGTGRLKKGYGVEPILRMMGVKNYCEVHNAINDAQDELLIMKKLGCKCCDYPVMKK